MLITKGTQLVSGKKYEVLANAFKSRKAFTYSHFENGLYWFKTTTPGLWQTIKEEELKTDQWVEKGFRPTKLIDLIPDFFRATISVGAYNTKDYYSKEYKTKGGLLKGLRAHYFFYAHKAISSEMALSGIGSGDTWNSGDTQFKITFSY